MSISNTADNINSDVTHLFLEKAHVILQQQGFIKNLEDVVAVCKYVKRSFVPRSKLSDPKLFKPANKLLCSLKIYLEETMKMYATLSKEKMRYKNVRQNYNFLTEVKRIDNMSALVSCDNLPDVSCTILERELRHDTIARDFSEREEFIGCQNLDKKVKLSLGGKRAIKKAVDCVINPKLKKSYKSTLDMNKDLYKIFINWVDSKRRSGERFVDRQWAFMFINYTAKTPSDKTAHHVKFYLSFDKFCSMMLTPHELMPKRFWRIFKFLKCLRDSKPMKLDTVSESILSMSMVREKDSRLAQPKDVRIQIARDFIKWYDKIFENLKRRGYLEEKDRYKMDEYKRQDFKVSVFGYYPRPLVLKRIKRVKDSLKSTLLRFVMENYLEKELPKENIKQIIYDEFFVTKLKKSTLGYLSYEDLYRPAASIPIEMFKGFTPENFDDKLREDFNIPLTKGCIELDESLGYSLHEVAILCLSMYKVYFKNRDCKKCLEYTCGEHSNYKEVARQLFKESNRTLSKGDIKKILRDSDQVFNSIQFDYEPLEKEIKRSVVSMKLDHAREMLKLTAEPEMPTTTQASQEITEEDQTKSESTNTSKKKKKKKKSRKKGVGSEV
jgi:hypothetical protein